MKAKYITPSQTRASAGLSRDKKGVMPDHRSKVCPITLISVLGRVDNISRLCTALKIVQLLSVSIGRQGPKDPNKPISNTMTPTYGTTHACLTSLANTLHCSSPPKVANGTAVRQKGQIATQKSDTEPLTDSCDHVAVNHHDGRYCAGLQPFQSRYAR
jgi:hypothetical protein